MIWNVLHRRAAWGLFLAILPAALLALVAVAAPDTQGVLRFDFETGDLQGWEVVEGAFERPVCDREFFHNEPTVPYSKQGRYLLSTLARNDPYPDDRMVGVIESPVFVLEGPTITFMVGGGERDETYVALCTDDGREVRHARGPDHERMQPVEWHVPELVGKRAFLRVVDRSTGGWGHITCDDFRMRGRLDAEATRTRNDRRRSERFAAAAGSLRAAVHDLVATFGDRYARGSAYLRRLDELQAAATARPDALTELETLRREALLDNPLLTQQPIAFVVRPQYRPDHHSTETLFQVGELNTASFEGGSALKLIDFSRGGEVRTLLELPEGIVRDPEVSFDGSRMLVSMRRSRDDDYHIYEVTLEAPPRVRQLTFGQELADIDPMYLPDGSIVFSSTRDPKLCQCNRHIQANLFRMDADGSNIRQIGRNTLFEGHPSLMPDGRIVYYRWEYVDKHFGPAFGLWTANPDGTNHAVYYHNNAWSPGAILDPRAVPGTRYVVATFGSCHDRPWGAIAIVDAARGLEGHLPLVHTWPADLPAYLTNRKDYGEGLSEHRSAYQIDSLVRLQPKYEDPYPLSAKYILCSRMVSGERMGLFLLDVFGNEILLHVEGPGCYDPIPVAPRPVPPRIPDRVRHAETEGTLYLTDVYRGEGMERVKRGAIKYLRVVEAPPKRFWSNGSWGIDATQAPAMNWNCTSNKRILGDVPVAPDGSAYFRVPADRFVFFQALDADKMMVQTMRSGTMVRPGEKLGCVGCHEGRTTTVPSGRRPSTVTRPPSALTPWYGPERDFSYAAEVQPVFDRHCVGCHDYGKAAGRALVLAGDPGLVFNASYSALRSKSGARWTPHRPGAPRKLVKAVDDGPAEILPAYAWGSHRSRLVDVIRGEHHGVQLDRESVERIVTWIDMNAPYYGSYSTPYPDHPFGRSPLDGAQLGRLSQLVGKPLGDVASEFEGSQISFARPAMSPALSGLAERDPAAFAEALQIIEAGRRRLAETPREDMPGWKLTASDARRQSKADRQGEEERAVLRRLAERERAAGSR
ncbi:MAG: hypothetical protein GX446_04300 [Chthonomonadales bacterium]|nr:hypothetical protein [Chthonomonadales bacterium]